MAVQAHFEEADLAQLCLIFSGKILKEDETLKQHGKDARQVMARLSSGMFCASKLVRVSSPCGLSLGTGGTCHDQLLMRCIVRVDSHPGVCYVHVCVHVSVCSLLLLVEPVTHGGGSVGISPRVVHLSMHSS